MEKSSTIFLFISLMGFIVIIFIIIFYNLPTKKRIDKKIESKIDKHEVKKITFEETFAHGPSSLITKRILEFGEIEHKKCKEKEEKISEKLRKIIEKEKQLGKSFEKFSELLRNFDEGWAESINITKDFARITNDFEKINEELHKSWKEIYELYLNTKTQRNEYIKRTEKFIGELLDTYCEIACDSCLIKLELIAKSGWRISKVKKIG